MNMLTYLYSIQVYSDKGTSLGRCLPIQVLSKYIETKEGGIVK